MYFCDIMTTLIFVQIMISWFVTRDNSFYRVLESITGPILRMAKRVTPRTGILDFSPIVAFIGLEVLKNIWLLILAQVFVY